MSKLLKIEELADRLGLRPSTIRRWVKTGKLSAIRPSQTVLRFAWADVVADLKRIAQPRSRPDNRG